MKQIMLTAFCASVAAAGCTYEDPADRPSAVARAYEPIYQYREDGRITATSCLSRKRSGYGRVPSACAVDNAFGGQVVNTTDLVQPQQPGDSYASAPARAAYEYIFGEDPNAANGGQGRQAQPGNLIVVDPAAQVPEADAGEEAN